jgi:Flp pilus assembly protein TadG
VIRTWKRWNERGAVTLELVLVVPGLVIMLGLMIAGGRLWFAKSTVTDAAQAAARAASLARTAGQATADGRSAGAAALDTRGLRCSGQSISVETSAFRVPAGTPAAVHATITCRVPFGDVLLPGMPGSITVTRTGSSALDTYRGRS